MAIKELNFDEVQCVQGGILGKLAEMAAGYVFGKVIDAIWEGNGEPLDGRQVSEIVAP